MSQNELKISEGGKRILNTCQKELFPTINKLKELLISIQKCRISYQLYSSNLNKLEKEYYEISLNFFEVSRKLETPDIIFEGLEGEAQYMADYFQYQNAFLQNLSDGKNYVEIIDRTLDRKSQSIQNNRTFLLAVVAIIVALLWR